MRIIAVICLLLVALPEHAHARKTLGVSIGGGLKVDIHAPAQADQRRFFKRNLVPVVVYVHGGGWIKGSRDKVYRLPKFTNDRGWMLISVDYRAWPRADIDAQLSDVTRGIRWVQRNIKRYGGDPKKVAIMGHSAGSHLVAMVGAKKTAAGIVGVIANDVQAYDMEAYAGMRGSLPHMYAKAFGTTPKNWARWSPITYVKRGRRFAPHLIMHSGGNITARRRALSRGYGAELKRRGTLVEYFDGRRYSHGAIAARIGSSPEVTRAVESFLKRVFR